VVRTTRYKFSSGLAVFAQDLGDEVLVCELIHSSTGFLGFVSFLRPLAHLVNVVGFSVPFPLVARAYH